MEDYIMEIMKRTSVFMILAQAVIHFRPNPSYEKYFKFLVGVMTIVILVIPLLELIHSGIGVQYVTSMKQFTDALAEITESEPDISALAADPSETYLEEMEYEIRVKLEKYAQEKGYHISRTEILEMMEHEPAGRRGARAGDEIRIRVYIEPQADGGTEDKEDSVVRIEEIHIQGEEERKTGSSREAEAEFRKAFAGLLEIEEDRLEVTIIE